MTERHIGSAQRARSLSAHCTQKVRYDTRIAARMALNARLGDREEEMGAYPCKFCQGWHVGHTPVDRYRDFEPNCICGHKAITHDSYVGLGCFECSCLVHREWVYRKAIRTERKTAAALFRQRKSTLRFVQTMIRLVPSQLARHFFTSLGVMSVELDIALHRTRCVDYLRFAF
jgi:hypothetical protein